MMVGQSSSVPSGSFGWKSSVLLLPVPYQEVKTLEDSAVCA